eukprot:gnl/Hemi2/9127_TR3168_c0_g1_i1.p2 gnl/Hemi2/9127_TR3168_c0_g1~~gnl/Hemi2/9127_TR3168_c0_g1_i1.p2  ORF type:complete len:136 (+),score=31.42 gnl/Hemi2/9127_TR3168_c0_g1_i1:87-494(+)
MLAVLLSTAVVPGTRVFGVGVGLFVVLFFFWLTVALAFLVWHSNARWPVILLFGVVTILLWFFFMFAPQTNTDGSSNTPNPSDNQRIWRGALCFLFALGILITLASLAHEYLFMKVVARPRTLFHHHVFKRVGVN